MLFHLEGSKSNKRNSWSEMSRVLDIAHPSIVKNTFYSRATSYLKKISLEKPINFDSDEERARMVFYMQYALRCLKGMKTRTKKKVNYFDSLLTDYKLSNKVIYDYACSYGLSLSTKPLMSLLNTLINKHSVSYEHSHIILPPTIYLPITASKELLGVNFSMVGDSCLDGDQRNSLVYLVTYQHTSTEAHSFCKISSLNCLTTE